MRTRNSTAPKGQWTNRLRYRAIMRRLGNGQTPSRHLTEWAIDLVRAVNDGTTRRGRGLRNRYWVDRILALWPALADKAGVDPSHGPYGPSAHTIPDSAVMPDNVVPIHHGKKQTFLQDGDEPIDKDMDWSWLDNPDRDDDRDTSE